jgi:hypothetical protein
VTVRVTLSVGEDYPHLFAVTGGDAAVFAASPEAAGLINPPVVVELPEEDWADYLQAEDAYYTWVERLNAMRAAVLAARVP